MLWNNFRTYVVRRVSSRRYMTSVLVSATFQSFLIKKKIIKGNKYKGGRPFYCVQQHTRRKQDLLLLGAFLNTMYLAFLNVYKNSQKRGGKADWTLSPHWALKFITSGVAYGNSWNVTIVLSHWSHDQHCNNVGKLSW